jgi:hypothetical protein
MEAPVGIIFGFTPPESSKATVTLEELKVSFGFEFGSQKPNQFVIV